MTGRVLIIDDHPVVLYGLRFLFERQDRFTICGEAADSATARSQAEALQPDFVILDLVLGGRDGLDLVQEIAVAAPSARILVYSSQNEWRFARRCLQAGAQGYVAKSEGLTVVANALDIIADGDTFISDAVRQKLAETFEVGGVLVPAATIDQLSKRELQVLQMIGGGQATREIADALDISIKTVGTYYERIKTKMQVTSLRDLEALARDHVTGRHTI